MSETRTPDGSTPDARTSDTRTSDSPTTDTRAPDAAAELVRPRIASALQLARANLVVRPPAAAPEVVQGIVMPLLHALGIEVFDLERFRRSGDSGSDHAEYRLHSADREIRFLVLPADAPLPTAPGDGTSDGVISNGRNWRIGGAGGTELDLFDEELPRALDRLFNGAAGDEQSGEGTATHETNGVHDTGEKQPARRPQKEFVPAGPFERITIDEVRGYAEAVRNMRGKLQVWFDGEQVEVTSRAAFYYVLAELALRHGREDAIPGDDLVLPPDEPPTERRSLPLARPGSHLLVDLEPGELELRTLGLLDALGLTGHFTATQRGQPYPVRPA